MAERDTQWARYQVFLQEKIGSPHQDVGSVHAPDPEMALQNARDVFVRRPECVSIWVVPAHKIYARTAQEIAAGAVTQDRQKDEQIFKREKPETYCLFSKQRSAGTQTLRGEIQASNPVEALEKGLQTFSGDKQPFAWMVFPKRLIMSSNRDDIESMFAPAREKSFRMATDFHTLTEMRKIMSRKKDE